MRGRALHRTALVVRLGMLAALAGAAVPAAAHGKPATPPAKAAAAPAASPFAQRYAQLCAACHGANGRSEMVGTPVLAGQHSFYAITQLFLFREGRRPNEAMTALAKGMKDDDLRGFSDYIGTLPAQPAPAPATPNDAARMARGKALAQENRCVICHGPDLSGGQQVPRIAQQKEEYLKLALHEFKQGKRVGYTQAMGEAVRSITPEDLDTLAYYIARLDK